MDIIWKNRKHLNLSIESQIQRMIESIKNNLPVFIICPKCGLGPMEPGSRGIGNWDCPWYDCLHSETKIPSEESIKHLINLKQDLELIERYKI